MRWWSVANFVSNAGTWMQLTVQNLLVLQITGSAAATGLSMSVQAGPALFMSLLGGAAVDRWSRKLTAAGTTVLQTDPPPHLRGRVPGAWSSVGTVWNLGGPPALGLLMELAGARGALVTGGLLVAGAIGAGFLVRARRPLKPVALPAKPGGEVAGREALSTAA
jgi:hypothetical protein